MKILFITHNKNPNIPSNDFYNEYMNDLLLHGLREIYGFDVIDYPGAWYLYEDESRKRQLDKKYLWGKGITTNEILNDFNSIDRSNILEKIKKKYFDIVIYGSIQKNNTFIEEAIKYNNNLIFIDGEDSQFLQDKLISKGLYFKRELKNSIKNVFPINFAIPKDKIVSNIKADPKFLLSPLIPGKLNTYIYENENSYYEMYQNSAFSLTYKKLGWDCLRHYEILMNGSLPIFLNINKCPDLTMHNFPKKIIGEITNKYEKILNFYNPFKIFKKKFLNMSRFFNFFTYKSKDISASDYLQKNQDINEFRSITLEFTKKNLTTQNLAKYVIDKFISLNK